MIDQASLAASLGQSYAGAVAVTPTACELLELTDWIRSQWAQIPAPIKFTYGEQTLAQAFKRYIDCGELLISVAHNSHPYLSFTENAMFRAVHDWHHIISGSDDTLMGEIASYYVARTTAPQSIWWILRSEIVLQAAACIHYGRFLDQKLVKV